MTKTATPRSGKKALGDDAFTDAVATKVVVKLRRAGQRSGKPLQVLFGDPDTVADLLLRALPTPNPLAEIIGPVYRPAGLADAAGVKRQSVTEWMDKRRVGAVTTGDNVRVIPAAHLGDDLRPLRGLQAVLVEIGDSADPWTVAAWLEALDDRLNGRSPLDALRDGDLDGPVSIARAARRRWAA